MHIRVLGAFGSEGLGQRPSSFLVNDRVLVDAGSVSSALSPAEQQTVEHVLITHSHLDHVAGLAFLTETLACLDATRPVIVTSFEPIVDALRISIFNNIVWPDFSRIPAAAPVVKYRALVEAAEQRVGDLWVTPITVSHTIPTCGFIIHDGETGFVYSGDTGPTTELWKAIRGMKGLSAILLECAFPSRMEALAEVSKHMTPARIRRELDKLPPDIPVWIYHVKPQFYDETAEELSRIDSRRITLVEQDKTYTL
jgi:ribonuclease BN (tRNA processing enzyme)